MTNHSNEATPVPSDALAQLIRTPLAGQVMGLEHSQFVLAEWSDPGSPPSPPRPIAPLHVHYADDEAWYVLEGKLAFRLGEQEIEAPAGSAVFAPRGVPHTYWNPQTTRVRYLLIMTPTIRQLIAALHQNNERDPVAIQAIYARHNSALVP